MDPESRLDSRKRFPAKASDQISVQPRTARHTTFTEIDAELEERVYAMLRPAAIARALISRRRRGELITTFVIGLLIPALENVQDAVDRTNANLELMRLAAALSVFRAENGHYPEKLDELVPGIVAALPIDIYSEQPPIYKAVDDRAGCVLYSVGENGVDDGGTDVSGWIVDGEWRDDVYYDFHYTADEDPTDQVIRFPVPPMKLPDVITDAATEAATDRSSQ